MTKILYNSQFFLYKKNKDFRSESQILTFNCQNMRKKRYRGYLKKLLFLNLYHYLPFYINDMNNQFIYPFEH